MNSLRKEERKKKKKKNETMTYRKKARDGRKICDEEGVEREEDGDEKGNKL